MLERIRTFVAKLFGSKSLGWQELETRLGLTRDQIEACQIRYREFSIRKRSGGKRKIAAPEKELKQIQRRILRRLLAKLNVHPAATGFEPGKSFVTNALPHRGQAIVIRFDIKDFFPSITADRVETYFRQIGWDRPVADMLTKLVTHRGVLPQGAPTSPRLSNLVCYRLDTRLDRLVARYRGVYTRYADDITISLTHGNFSLRPIIGRVVGIIKSENLQPHMKKKFDVRRQHQRQKVTGLVVNQQVNLPRETRRWLRSVAHRASSHWMPVSGLETGERDFTPPPTITRQQFDGWLSLIQMIRDQRGDPPLV